MYIIFVGIIWCNKQEILALLHAPNWTKIRRSQISPRNKENRAKHRINETSPWPRRGEVTANSLCLCMFAVSRRDFRRGESHGEVPASLVSYSALFIPWAALVSSYFCSIGSLVEGWNLLFIASNYSYKNYIKQHKKLTTKITKIYIINNNVKPKIKWAFSLLSIQNV